MRDLHHSSIIVGRKGVGKSTELNKIARAYPTAKKVLIIDVNGSPAYNEHQQIEVKQIKLVRQGVVKLLGTPTKETLKIIAEHFRNGLVIFEDCTKYISGNVDPSIKTFLVDHRMYNCDLIFTFHSIKMVPPFFWQMISYCTLFKTAETFDNSYKNRLPNYEALSKAFNRIKAHKNERYKETVETLI